VRVAAEGGGLDGVVVHVASLVKVEVAVEQAGSGPVFRTAHQRPQDTVAQVALPRMAGGGLTPARPSGNRTTWVSSSWRLQVERHAHVAVLATDGLLDVHHRHSDIRLSARRAPERSSEDVDQVSSTHRSIAADHRQRARSAEPKGWASPHFGTQPKSGTAQSRGSVRRGVGRLGLWQ
jgi:hypothetical protein